MASVARKNNEVLSALISSLLALTASKAQVQSKTAVVSLSVLTKGLATVPTLSLRLFHRSN